MEQPSSFDVRRGSLFAGYSNHCMVLSNRLEFGLKN